MTDIIKAFFTGIRDTLVHQPLVLLVYGANLLLALLLAFPLFGILDHSIGHSMAFEQLEGGFNMNIFRDFMTQHGDKLSSIPSQSIWIIVIYMLLNIFFNGGIINAFLRKNKQGFFSNCRSYFMRFFRLSFLSLMVQIIGSLLVLLPFYFYFKAKSGVLNDAEYFQIGSIALGICFFLVVFVNMVSDYAKIHMVAQNTRSAFLSFFQALRLSFRYFFRTYFLYLTILGIILLLYFVYWKTTGLFNAQSLFSLLLLFIAQQFFLYCRISSRILNFASAAAMYQSFK